MHSVAQLQCGARFRQWSFVIRRSPEARRARRARRRRSERASATPRVLRLPSSQPQQCTLADEHRPATAQPKATIGDGRRLRAGLPLVPLLARRARADQKLAPQPALARLSPRCPFPAIGIAALSLPAARAHAALSICVYSPTVPTLSLLTIHRPGRSPSLERIGKKRQIRSAGGVGILRGLHRRRQRAVAGAADACAHLRADAARQDRPEGALRRRLARRGRAVRAARARPIRPPRTCAQGLPVPLPARAQPAAAHFLP